MGPGADNAGEESTGGFSGAPAGIDSFRFENGISLPAQGGTYQIAEPRFVVLSSDVDGSDIEVGIFKPVLAEGERVPVLISAGDFGAQFSVRDIPRVQEVVESPFLRAENFIPYGYAIVTVTHRGAGGSGGCYDYFGPETAADLAQAIDWVRVEPWSTGDIGLFGFSAWGISGWLAAAYGDDVKTVVTMGASPDMYTSFFHNGTLGGRGGAAVLAGILGPNNLLGVRDDGTIRDPVHVTEGASCTDTAQQMAAIADVEATAGRDRFGFYEERDLRDRVMDRYQGSVFFVHGIHDSSVSARGSIPWIQELADSGVPVKQWIGQWDHDLPDQDIFRDTGDSARRDDFGQVLLDWMDYWVRGNKSVDLGPRVEVQDSSHRWQAFDAYPPNSGDRIHYSLSADGTLVMSDPIPGDLTIMPQQVHDAPQSEAPFAYEFVSPPLDHDMVISGLPVVDLRITPEAPMGQIGAWLYAERAGDYRLVTSGTLDLRLAGQDETPQPVEPGSQLATRVQMLPTHTLLEADETLVLRLWHHGQHLFPHASESGPLEISVGGAHASLSFMALSDASLDSYQPPIR